MASVYYKQSSCCNYRYPMAYIVIYSNFNVEDPMTMIVTGIYI